MAFAQTVTYTPRVPTPLPTVDLALGIVATPVDVISGQQVTIVVTLTNNSATQAAEETIMNIQLPEGLRYLSCYSSLGSCLTDGGASSGYLNFRLYTIPSHSQLSFTITAQAVAPPNSSLPVRATVTNCPRGVAGR